MNIIKEIKHIVNRYPDYKTDEIIKKLSEFKFVSFDIFDTLVKRKVLNSYDIFEAVEEKYREQLTEWGIQEFKQMRILAEKTARKQITDNNEVTLAEIYNNLTGVDPKYREKLISYELEQERVHCCANPSIKAVYQWCLENKKKIIIISDIYLPAVFVKELLNQCGYKKYDDIFISSEIGLRKATGELFTYVLKSLNICCKDLIHIGDSIQADYYQAIIRGVKSIKIAREPQKTMFSMKTKIPHEIRKEYGQLMHLLNIQIDRSWNEYYQFGYEIIGPLLYCMSVWIHKDALDKNIDKLFFLSRDGYLMQKVYQAIYGDNTIPNEYLYVSRRALRMSQIWIHSDLNDVSALFPPFAYLNCQDFCEGLGIEAEIGEKAWKSSGLKIRESLLPEEFARSKKFCDFYTGIKDQLIQQSKIEYDNVVSFICQHEVSGKVGIVDIGWSGTIQKCLQTIVDQSETYTELHGYYLGMEKKFPGELRAESFLPVGEQLQEFAAALVEYPFLAAEGSVKRYIVNETGVVIPELSQFEYENLEEKQMIQFIQTGAVDFAEMMGKDTNSRCFARKTVIYNFKSLVRKPQKRIINMFGDLHFYDGRMRYIAHPSFFIDYWITPRKFRYDLSNAGWKIGFLRRFFKIPLPYYEIMKFVKSSKLREWAKK